MSTPARTSTFQLQYKMEYVFIVCYEKKVMKHAHTHARTHIHTHTLEFCTVNQTTELTTTQAQT
jgi:hypothetical protein